MGEGIGKGTCSNLYPCAPRPAVAVVVQRDDGRILMVRRAKEPAKGTWSVPGGSIELGEGLMDAARREVLEETGVEILPLPALQWVDAIYVDRKGDGPGSAGGTESGATLEEKPRIRYHYLIIYVGARYLDGDVVAADDALEAGWFTLEEIEALNTPAGTVETIEKTLDLMKVV